MRHRRRADRALLPATAARRSCTRPGAGRSRRARTPRGARAQDPPALRRGRARARGHRAEPARGRAAPGPAARGRRAVARAPLGRVRRARLPRRRPARRARAARGRGRPRARCSARVPAAAPARARAPRARAGAARDAGVRIARARARRGSSCWCRSPPAVDLGAASRYDRGARGAARRPARPPRPPRPRRRPAPARSTASQPRSSPSAISAPPTPVNIATPIVSDELQRRRHDALLAAGAACDRTSAPIDG